MYRLWRDETLYHIWTKSSNLRRSYCDFSIWPNDLEHVLRVALGSGIIFTKIDLRQLIRAWIIAFYADTLCYTAILMFDLLTLNFYSISGVMFSNSVQNVSLIE